MIALDSSVLIAHLTPRDIHHPRATEFLYTVGAQELVIHSLNLAEVLVGGMRIGRASPMLEHITGMGITVADRPDGEALRLARVRARSGLRLPDCCALDTALANGCALATFDDRLADAARAHRVQVAPEAPRRPSDLPPEPGRRTVMLGHADAGEVLTLQRAAYVPEAQRHDDVDLPPLHQTLAELAAELADPQVLTLGTRAANDRLLAAVRARLVGETAELGRLTVVPDRQGQGLGTALLQMVEDRLPAEVTELRLFTGERSDANLRLYARLGYTETHREPTPAGYALVHLRKPRSP